MAYKFGRAVLRYMALGVACLRASKMNVRFGWRYQRPGLAQSFLLPLHYRYSGTVVEAEMRRKAVIGPPMGQKPTVTECKI